MAEQLTGIDDWCEAIFAANVVFEPLVGELFRSRLVMQAAPRNGDFVTPTVIGAEEYDFAERDLRYTIPMFHLLTKDREFADQNKGLLSDWLGTWTARGAPPFMIFHDSVLRALAEAPIRTLADLRGVRGIGTIALNKHGGDLLEILVKDDSADADADGV